jgi:predicted RNA polymerase sigma factor
VLVDLNCAIAHSMDFGPEAGLRLVDEIADVATLRHHAPLPPTRGLFRAGRLAKGRVEFEAAAKLTRNGPARAFLLGRAATCDCKH